jgi:hypothetical protein
VIRPEDFVGEDVKLAPQTETKLVFEASLAEILRRHPLLDFPKWLSTYATLSSTDGGPEDALVYTRLFNLKRSANPPLIRAAKPSQANNNKPKQVEQAKKAKQPSQPQPQQPKKPNAGGGGQQTPRANNR